MENIGIYLSPSYSGKYIPVGNVGKYYKKNGTISGLCRVTSESTKKSPGTTTNFLEPEMTFWWDSTLLHFWPSTVVNGIKLSATTVSEGCN